MPLTQVLNDLGVEFRENGQSPHVSPGWVGLLCPWCGRNTGNYGLGVNLSSYACNCWKCGSHSLAEALHEITGLGYAELRSRLGEAPESIFTFRKKLKGNYIEPDGLTEIGPHHRHYLNSRGFDDEKIVELMRIWKIQGIGLSQRATGSIFIPVIMNGEKVSWTTRSTREGARRYDNAKESESAIPIKNTLLGIDYVRHSAIVVEGPFDCFRIGPGSVATFGTAYSKTQVAMLSKIPVRVICFDSDAKSQSHRLCQELHSLPGVTYQVHIDSKDPGSATQEEIDSLRKEFLE